MTNDCSRVAAYADAVLPLAGAALDDAYYYRSVSLCVIDAVYSIGVQYEGVQAVVRRYCDYFGLGRIRPNREVLPPKHLQESISTLCEHYDDLGLERMKAEVFCNRQRTSTRSGILKAEAVQRFALSLQCRGIEHLQDVSRFLPNEALERDIRAIPGQRSGISFQYFWMLAGSDDLIKPDRMILRFLETALDRTVQVPEAQPLLASAAGALKSKHPQLTPRLLDFKIWEYQRDR